MQRIKQYVNRKKYGHLLLSSAVGLLCILYLATTGTPEDQRLIDALAEYCYAHYAVINRPTPKNESRFMRYEEKLARLSKGKFNHLDKEEVKAFLRPRGYAYEMEDGDGKVEYFLARFTEHGHFKASGSGSSSYDYFLLDRIHVYPYNYYPQRERGRNPFVLFVRNGSLYLRGWRIREIFTVLFNDLRDSKVTGVSNPETAAWCKILHRAVEEIWRETYRLHHPGKTAREYFVEHALESCLPAILDCVSREYYYRKQGFPSTKALELAYLRSLMGDRSLFTLGLLCYLADVVWEPCARDLISAFESEGLGEVGLENCSLDQIQWAAKKAFELKNVD